MRNASEKTVAGSADIDVRELSTCTCFSLRRVARQITQLYDRLLAPAGLTAGQFGLLVQLHGISGVRAGGISIGALADRVGMDPTTLTRTLKPLAMQGLVADASDPEDRRVRAVLITNAGRRRLKKAAPLWRRAQEQLDEVLGTDAARSLRDVLDAASTRLRM